MMASILKFEYKIYITSKTNSMTLLKVYNKNGHCGQAEGHAFGISSIMNNFPYRDHYTSESRYGIPRVNIKEISDSYSIEMEVPGINKKLLKMNILKDMLTISYQDDQVQNNEKFTYREFNYRNFERSFYVPESVEKEKISAQYSEGILLVSLPKKDEAVDNGPRSIEIS